MDVELLKDFMIRVENSTSQEEWRGLREEMLSMGQPEQVRAAEFLHMFEPGDESEGQE